MSIWQELQRLFLWVEAGVIVSLVLPWARAQLWANIAVGKSADSRPWWVERLSWLANVILPYLGCIVASNVISLFIFMWLVEDANNHPGKGITETKAFFTGFFADVLVAKLSGREKPLKLPTLDSP